MFSQAPKSRRAEIEFEAGNDAHRAARHRCASACHDFNKLDEDSIPSLRVRAWLSIVDPSGLMRNMTPDAAVTSEIAFQDPSIKPSAPLVKPPIYIDYGLRVYIAATAFINRNCTILDTPVADVRIGEHCNIGPNVGIYGVGHPLTVEQNLKRKSLGSSVVIGDCVWIGGGCIIMPGVTVGNHAVIGAGSVVTHDVPAYTLAYGNPAAVVRSLGKFEVTDEAEAVMQQTA
ncbi:acetyltransferase [Apiospora rasikravindrae]|uniref:Acetyltransferase n=1 Tax=Apiospora rasikravindrae TaxID=990691 RepID=A0ABR1SW71_9PEZI